MNNTYTWPDIPMTYTDHSCTMKTTLLPSYATLSSLATLYPVQDSGCPKCTEIMLTMYWLLCFSVHPQG